jgi:lysozyme
MADYRDIAREQLKFDEGVKSKPYRCTAGKLSIGVGRNLEDVGLSTYEINVLLENDLVRSETDAKILFPSFDKLSDERKAVLLNMSFNLGRDRLAGFKNFRAAVEAGAWAQAAAEMENSKWAVQVKDRAQRLASKMRQG